MITRIPDLVENELQVETPIETSLQRRPGHYCSPQFGQAVGKLRFRESSFPSTPTSRRRYWIDYSVFDAINPQPASSLARDDSRGKNYFRQLRGFAEKVGDTIFASTILRTDVTETRRQKLV